MSFPRLNCVVVYAVIATFIYPPASIYAVDPPFRLFRLIPRLQDDVGVKPHTGEETCLEQLGRNIDWLEHEINVNGTVVAKTPDVWGEARMTAHRQEFEKELKRELSLFSKNQVNAAEFVSDQAFLSFALAIQGKTPTDGVTPPTVNISAAAASDATKVENGKAAITVSQGFTSPSQIFGFNPTTTTFGTNGGIQLEQTEVLNQLADYINHLHRLRRINEGDDTSDAPGYAMNLVRIPVSLLPGSATKHGYGAEITVTAEPYLGPELLPMTFRDLVVNDLVEQLAVPLTRFINNDPREMKSLETTFRILEQRKRSLAIINAAIDQGENLFGQDADSQARAEQSLGNKLGGLIYFQSNGATSGLHVKLEEAIPFLLDVDRLTVASGAKESPNTELASAATQLARSYVDEYDSNIIDHYYVNTESLKPFIDVAVSNSTREDMSKVEQAAVKTLSEISISLPASTVRKATLPFPPSHLIDNYGLHEIGHVFLDAHEALQSDILNREIVHVTDVQGLLREEIGAAYELLRTEPMRPWWEKAAAEPRRLYEAIRLRQQPEVDRMREEFLDGIGPFTRHHRSTASLAWCVYLDSLLLNERLIDDMRDTFGNRPGVAPTCDWLPYFGPNPPQEARDAFSYYVKVRWPIHVFQIDPVVTEQNVADVRSIYRQMQMSVAMAFSSKQIGLSAALQAMRKLQRDRATFDLNRTIVGFGHGDDTFGWRFYPRFQTPPVESNVTVLFRDLILGGPTDKQLECSKEIEPGVRECVAIVLMPSFVPHITFHTRGNWFKLNCASRTAASVHDTLQYSRVVKQMEMNSIQCGQCAHLYRDGEVDRLLHRVHQLDRKLALQTLPCQIPIENTHGGFEIFSSGTRELAPELVGWYGAPGYDPTRPGKLFLSGDNFNVTTCKLIAGNQEIPFNLLSRQILEASFPAGLPVIRDPKLDAAGIDQYSGYIDAQLATPYGVSSHLLIPVVRTEADPGRVTMAPHVAILSAKATNATTPTAKVELDLTTDAAKKSFLSLFVPPQLSSGNDSEKLVLTTMADGNRLADSEITVTRTTAIPYVIEDSKVPGELANAPNKLGFAITDYLNFIASTRNAFPTTVQFEVTAGVIRGSGEKRVILPVDGTITFLVVVDKAP